MLKKLSNGYYMGSATPASGGGSSGADEVAVTNLSGSSISAGDKVYLKKQTAQQESRTEKTDLNSKNILINPAGSKVMSPTFIYDISTGTKTTVSGISTNDYRVIKYKGQYIFCGQNVFGDGVSTSPFTWYAQGNYGVTDKGNSTGYFVRKYDDTLSNVLQEWSVPYVASNICEWCVVKNHIYTISYRDSAYKLFEGTIDESSETISMTQIQLVSQSDITASRYPAQTTIDDKIGIFANAKQGISLTRMNDDGSISVQFLSNNTDLSGIILSGVGTVFNKYTGILTSETISSDGNGGYSATVYIFKYNPTTVDFDTVSIIRNIPSSSDYSTSYDGYYTASVSNDLSKMVVNTYQMQTYLMNLAVAEGGYNAVPYSMGQDIITGTASENALPNATFNALVNAYDKLIDKKKYNITIDSIVGDVNDSGVLQAPTVEGNLVFTGVKEVANKGLYSAFANKETITSVSFPDLETLNNSQSAQSCFFQNIEITSISLPKLKTIGGYGSAQSFFSSCKKLTSVSLPELETISGYQGAVGFFSNCLLLSSISLPKLKSLTGTESLRTAFYYCDLRTVEFPMLSDVSGSECLRMAFCGNTNFTSLSFPALKTTSFGSRVNQFNGIFDGQTAQISGAFTMHFPSNLEATIQGLTGYPDFGATAGRLTLAYDLPATE